MDALLEARIEPFVTLYHWDLPQALQDEGGWPARQVADAFAEYADVVSRSLGDRVTHWMTLNEPHVSALVGYLEGEHAPGHKNLREALASSHHLLLAHGMAVPIIRANSPNSEVGLALDFRPQTPASPSAADRDAAWHEGGVINRWFLDPVAGRGYPDDMRRAYGVEMDFVLDGDMDRIAAPLDFLGLNYYFRNIARSSRLPEAENLPRTTTPSDEVTEMGWEVYPAGLYEMLGQVHFGYNFPALYITENGAAYRDQIGSRRASHGYGEDFVHQASFGETPRGDRHRRARAWLFPLVTAGQLRVDVRDIQALRPDPRGLPNPEPHPQGQRAVVPLCYPLKRPRRRRPGGLTGAGHRPRGRRDNDVNRNAPAPKVDQGLEAFAFEFTYLEQAFVHPVFPTTLADRVLPPTNLGELDSLPGPSRPASS